MSVWQADMLTMYVRRGAWCAWLVGGGGGGGVQGVDAGFLFLPSPLLVSLCVCVCVCAGSLCSNNHQSFDSLLMGTAESERIVEPVNSTQGCFST